MLPDELVDLVGHPESLLLIIRGGDPGDVVVNLGDRLAGEVGVAARAVDLLDIGHRVLGLLPGEGGDAEVLDVDVVGEVLVRLHGLHRHLDAHILELRLQEVALVLGGRGPCREGEGEGEPLAILLTNAVGPLRPARVLQKLLGRLGVEAPVAGVVLVPFLDGEEEAVAQQQLLGVHRQPGQVGGGDRLAVAGAQDGLADGLLGQGAG